MKNILTSRNPDLATRPDQNNNRLSLKFCLSKLQKCRRILIVFILPLIMSFTLGKCEGIGMFFPFPCHEFGFNSFQDITYPYGVTVSGQVWKWSALRCQSASLVYTVPGGHSLHSIAKGGFLGDHVAVGNSGTIIKTNILEVWSLVNSPTTQALWDVCFSDSGDNFDTVADSSFYAVGDSGTIIKSTDLGESWFSLPIITAFNLYEVQCSEDGTILVFGEKTAAFKSTDGGNTWSEMNLYGGLNNFLQSGGPDIYASFFLNPDIGYVFGEFGAIFYTSNGGNNWQPGIVPDFDRINTAYFISPDSGMVAGDNGKVRFTINGGATWVEDTSVSKLTSNNINQILIIDTSIAVLVGDGGTVIFVARDSTALTSVDTYDEIVAEYQLYHNYPNPFNPSTIIEYSLPQYGYVTLKLYDMLGREIATLVNEEKSAGNYKFEFNAGGLASGIYYYHITVGNEFVETRKMVLLR